MNDVENYDSYNDTMWHIQNIQFIIDVLMILPLMRRSRNHDKSKLENPEKQSYDKYIPLLKKAEYGSEEYNRIKEEMYSSGLGHHFKENRHHVEHYKNGISDMTIVDIVEMICDWFAASMRSDSSFLEGVEINKKKYNIPNELVEIIKNTYHEYFEEFDNIAGNRVPFKDYSDQLLSNVKDSYNENKITRSELHYIQNDINRIDNMI